MSRPVPNPGILDIAPYTPGKSPVPEPGRKVFKLSANETPFGPSPKAMAVYKEAAAHLEDYPEGTSRVLREAIGRAFGLDPGRIICGAGSDEILNLVAHAYLSHGDEAISTTHGFLVYPIATKANGAINVVAPETNFTADVDAILKLVSPRTKLVWLANPNNPTGTYLPFDEVKRLRAGLPPHVLLVLDAAYSDYVSRNDYELGLELVATTENTVMTHTFSKIHGLAALRIGWMFGPANIVDAVNRIRGPFNVSTPAMLAAVAAIEDTAHVQMSKVHTEKWRNWLTEEIGKLGLKVTLTPETYVAEGLVRALADRIRGKHVLLARASIARDVIPDALRAAGADDLLVDRDALRCRGRHPGRHRRRIDPNRAGLDLEDHAGHARLDRQARGGAELADDLATLGPVVDQHPLVDARTANVVDRLRGVEVATARVVGRAVLEGRLEDQDLGPAGQVDHHL